MPRPRILVFLAVALVATAGFVRLGFWQLSRLGERQEANRSLAGRLESPPASFAEIVADTTGARYRRTSVRGTWDYIHQLVLTARSRQGSPGVHVLTPLRPADGGPAVLVNRGWIYAADGMTADLDVWAEGDSAQVTGFVDTFTNLPGPVSTPSVVRAVRRLTADSLAARFPYPIAPVLVVRQDTAAAEGRSHPVRVEPPSLSEGSHRSYALQWFAFALITLIGTAAVLRRESGPRRNSAAK